VLSATVAGVALAAEAPPPGRLAGDIASRDLAIAALIVAGPRPDGLTAILDVTDDAGRPVIGLARDGDDLLFSVRTVANSLRLRGATVRLVDAFPEKPDARISVEAGLRGSTLWAAIPGAIPMRAETRLTADQGWRLVAPLGGRVGHEVAALLTALWTAGPLAAALYWLVRGRRAPIDSTAR
jgi:hypothetical protein